MWLCNVHFVKNLDSKYMIWFCSTLQLVSGRKHFKKQVQQHQLGCRKEEKHTNNASSNRRRRHYELYFVNMLLLYISHLVHDLGYHLCKLQIIQRLKETKFARWETSANSFCITITRRHGTSFRLWDTLQLNKNVKKQNMCYRSADNPSWQIIKHFILNR